MENNEQDAGNDPGSTVVQEVAPDPAPAHVPQEPMDMDTAISKALDEQGATDEPSEPEDDEKGEKPEKVADKDKADKVDKSTKPARKALAKEGEGDDATGEDGDGGEEGEADEDEGPKESAPKKVERPHGKKVYEAPEDFLPSAKEKWQNVPHEVRSEIYRKIDEVAREREQYSEQLGRYEEVREFDDLARQKGGSLRESLARVHHIETLMQASPLAGLNAVLSFAGPRKPDGQPYSLFEAATAIVQMGQDGYHRAISQAQAPDPRQTEAEREQMIARIAALEAQSEVLPVIERFKIEHPRFDELSGAIAKVLKSGMVPKNMAPDERLAAAYDMAVRLNPTSHGDPEEAEEEPQPERRAGKNFGGSKTIKGSPPSGKSRGKSSRQIMTLDEAISAAMAAQR